MSRKMRRIRMAGAVAKIEFVHPSGFRVTLTYDDKEAIIETDEFGIACFARKAHEAIAVAESSYRQRIEVARKRLRGETA